MQSSSPCACACGAVQGGTTPKVRHSEVIKTPHSAKLTDNARGGREMGKRRNQSCYPGRGTPVGSRAPSLVVAARNPVQETPNWPLKCGYPGVPVTTIQVDPANGLGQGLYTINELDPSGGLGENNNASDFDLTIVRAKHERFLSQDVRTTVETSPRPTLAILSTRLIHLGIA